MTTSLPSKMSRLTRLAQTVLAAGLAGGPLHFARAAPPPNIVILLADDMGHGDLRCFNPESKIVTPHLDRLAREGMRFTDAHAPGSVCVPSRYGLLTGRYPFRGRMNPRSGPVIEAGRMTTASLLRSAGYDTGMIGKWHLGFEGGDDFQYDQPLRGGPVDRGFNSFFGIHASTDIPPYFYIENDRVTAAPNRTLPASNSPGWSPIQGAFWRQGPVGADFQMEDVLPNFTRRAVKFVNERKGAAKPFFLYVALPAPHTPWVPVKRWQGQSAVKLYGDFVMQVDDTVGQLLAALDQNQLATNTLFLFTSDNGPVWYPEDTARLGHSCTGRWRGMKGDAFEGGHRMPFIIRWPGVAQPGAATGETISFCDVLATFAELVGKPLPPEAAEDSFSFLPVLQRRETGRPIREATVNLSSRGFLSLRSGDWKLIAGLGSGGFSKPNVLKREKGEPAAQLYNLAEDPGETRNRYTDEPAVARRLEGLLQKYQQDGRSRP